MSLLVAQELYRFFHVGDEEVKALHGVSLAVEAGEMIALVGPSGSGKTTLLMCLAGLDEPDGGTVRLLDAVMTRRPEIEKTRLRSKHLGVMRQKDNLFSHLTVIENVSLAQSLSGRAVAGGMLSVLGRIGMINRASFLPAQLSGGERARASLAVAMASAPRILLLDEPTGEVDLNTEEAILAILTEFRKHGGAVVVATHNLAVARIATVTLTMKDGKFLND
ncbi:MAG: ATP-binding cassette domain-containing protein [Alphaproteobacteria bacterium]|nr:MAG: ATP-binding cassette domain-containing protein [Alphaproteobacteria bacterium]